MKKGILFDLDGTLWDSSVQVAESWDIFMRQLPDVPRRVTTEDMQGWMGLQMDEIGRRCFAGYEISEERCREIVHACGEFENEYLLEKGGVLYPHLEGVLKDLSQDYFLAIISNCQEGYIETFLKHYEFEKYFADLECYGATKLSKGENIRLVCQRNGLDAAVYVGDIEGDYQSARQAGIPFIHAAYGFGRISDPVPEIHSLVELRRTAEPVFRSFIGTSF